MRAPVTIIAALFGGGGIRSAAVYSALPTTIASHFAGSGQANGFMPRDGFFAFFALTGGGTVLLLLAIPWLPRPLPLALFMFCVLELVLRANLARGPLASAAIEVLLVLVLVGTALSIAWLVRSFR